jgi:hypothetical protein
MIQLIKRMIFAWRYKRAVARACKYAKLYGRKYYVLYMGGKLKVVDGAYDFPGGFVTQGEKVGEVIFTERGIVTLQTQNTPVLLCRCLAREQSRIRDGLHSFTVFLPLFVCLFLFRCCCHSRFILCPSVR